MTTLDLFIRNWQRNRMEACSSSAMDEGFAMLPDSSIHTLLERPTPPYSTMTVQRAYVVWWHTGQKSELKVVCNYYHNLEAQEEAMSAEQRVASRMHELTLISNYPPKSKFLMEYFPNLYRNGNHKNNLINKNVHYKQVQAILQEVSQEEGSVFNLEGFHTMKVQKGTKPRDIILTSHMIRVFCKVYKKSLRVMLAEFQDFTKKTLAADLVENIAMYIHKQYIKDELLLESNMPKSFGFLDSDDEQDDAEEVRSRSDSGVESEAMEETSAASPTDDHTIIENTDEIQTDIQNEDDNINESRNQELFSIVPTGIENEAADIQEEMSEFDVYELVHNCNGQLYKEIDDVDANCAHAVQ